MVSIFLINRKIVIGMKINPNIIIKGKVTFIKFGIKNEDSINILLNSIYYLILNIKIK